MGRGTDYKTDKKVEFTRLTKDGGVETFYRIYATSKGGSYFHIEIPEDQLGLADGLLTARAKQLDAI